MDADAALRKNWHAMLFGIRRSIRYHQRRRAFYDRLDQISNALSLILGSAAIYGVLDKDAHAVAIAASMLVTVISAVNLILASSQRARGHFDLARRFSDLERQMLGAPVESTLLAAHAERLVIESDEPPKLSVLDCICHNELMRAEGYKTEDLAKITWWQRLFAPFVDIREDLIH
ncbi:hypothetical protein ASG35_03110 [Burkholderia sp. Leaf177]|uniref:hypothetical protein n=1 Tax=Burkholderia sp. Leaf177 TaxID=1736287 RepID=UPI0006FC5704|nr:hypothetical protein [Burkholderia sp. Leaf177]KQR90214.1 hypothetical protein ASG35_03110 [Burkholderia sp. Leaf177]